MAKIDLQDLRLGVFFHKRSLSATVDHLVSAYGYSEGFAKHLVFHVWSNGAPLNPEAYNRQMEQVNKQVRGIGMVREANHGIIKRKARS